VTPEDGRRLSLALQRLETLSRESPAAAEAAYLANFILRLTRGETVEKRMNAAPHGFGAWRSVGRRCRSADRRVRSRKSKPKPLYAQSVATLPPLSDAIITAVSRLVDDYEKPREPSHSDITTQMRRAGVDAADPHERRGKEKRVRAVLGWALENDEAAGRKFVSLLISEVQGCGGFRPESPNYVGSDPIENARLAFRSEGFNLALDGVLLPIGFDGLAGPEATEALRSYARRAARGADDDPLVVGTSKDLLEATAAQIMRERFGSYTETANFPTLLGQAFDALGLATPAHPSPPEEPASRRLQRSLYEAGCAVKGLRNKEGTGHGRPWLSSVSSAEARAAIRTMGTISDYLLDKLGESRRAE
jgi:Abortive infection C-terminus